MRKLYQILYNVGRLTDAPGGGRFLSRGGHFGVGRFPFLGDTLAVGFPFLGDTLAWGFPFWGTLWRGVSLSGGHFGVGFPFRGDILAWASLRGGKALGVTKPAFPPRAPPFRARRCSALWYGVVYW